MTINELKTILVSGAFLKCFSIYELERSGLGICVNNLSLSSPTVADDMLVASLSRSGLSGLMRICFIYACLWRFLHAALKSAIVVLNEKRMEYLSAERIWKLGDAIVAENDQYKHLGNICEKKSESR